jgi:hypothetical protein
MRALGAIHFAVVSETFTIATPAHGGGCRNRGIDGTVALLPVSRRLRGLESNCGSSENKSKVSAKIPRKCVSEHGTQIKKQNVGGTQHSLGDEFSTSKAEPLNGLLTEVPMPGHVVIITMHAGWRTFHQWGGRHTQRSP